MEVEEKLEMKARENFRRKFEALKYFVDTVFLKIVVQFERIIVKCISRLPKLHYDFAPTKSFYENKYCAGFSGLLGVVDECNDGRKGLSGSCMRRDSLEDSCADERITSGVSPTKRSRCAD